MSFWGSSWRANESVFASNTCCCSCSWVGSNSTGNRGSCSTSASVSFRTSENSWAVYLELSSTLKSSSINVCIVIIKRNKQRCLRNAVFCSILTDLRSSVFKNAKCSWRTDLTFNISLIRIGTLWTFNWFFIFVQAGVSFWAYFASQRPSIVCSIRTFLRKVSICFTWVTKRTIVACCVPFKAPLTRSAGLHNVSTISKWALGRWKLNEVPLGHKEH